MSSALGPRSSREGLTVSGPRQRSSASCSVSSSLLQELVRCPILRANPSVNMRASRRSLDQDLRSRGHTVVGIAVMGHAVACADHGPDLVLLDVRMPHSMAHGSQRSTKSGRSRSRRAGVHEPKPSPVDRGPSYYLVKPVAGHLDAAINSLRSHEDWLSSSVRAMTAAKLATQGLERAKESHDADIPKRRLPHPASHESESQHVHCAARSLLAQRIHPPLRPRTRSAARERAAIAPAPELRHVASRSFIRSALASDDRWHLSAERDSSSALESLCRRARSGTPRAPRCRDRAAFPVTPDDDGERCRHA